MVGKQTGICQNSEKYPVILAILWQASNRSRCAQPASLREASCPAMVGRASHGAAGCPHAEMPEQTNKTKAKGQRDDKQRENNLIIF